MGAGVLDGLVHEMRMVKIKKMGNYHLFNSEENFMIIGFWSFKNTENYVMLRMILYPDSG